MSLEDSKAIWHAKYPNGMWYYIVLKDNKVKVGRLKEKPNARRQVFYWQKGYYTSKTYWATLVHKVFDNEADFNSFLEKQNGT